jgi:hypothetical protein
MQKVLALQLAFGLSIVYVTYKLHKVGQKLNIWTSDSPKNNNKK